MTEPDRWPRGVERRRPRYAQNPNASQILGSALILGGLGALVGGALAPERDRGEGALLGAATGGFTGAFGAAAMSRTVAMSLEQALRVALGQMGLAFVSLRYYGRHEARLLFEGPTGFQVATARADTGRPWTSEDLDDWMYVALIQTVVEKMEASP